MQFTKIYRFDAPVNAQIFADPANHFIFRLIWNLLQYKDCGYRHYYNRGWRIGLAIGKGSPETSVTSLSSKNIRHSTGNKQPEQRSDPCGIYYPKTLSRRLFAWKERIFYMIIAGSMIYLIIIAQADSRHNS